MQVCMSFSCVDVSDPEAKVLCQSVDEWGDYARGGVAGGLGWARGPAGFLFEPLAFVVISKSAFTLNPKTLNPKTLKP